MLSTLFLGPSQVPLWGWHVLHTHACMADVGTAGLFEISAWWRTAQGHRIERDPCHPDRKDGEGVIEPKRGAYALPQARHGGAWVPRGAVPPFLLLRVPSLLTGLPTPTREAEALGHLGPCTPYVLAAWCPHTGHR